MPRFRLSFVQLNVTCRELITPIRERGDLYDIDLLDSSKPTPSRTSRFVFLIVGHRKGEVAGVAGTID